MNNWFDMRSVRPIIELSPPQTKPDKPSDVESESIEHPVTDVSGHEEDGHSSDEKESLEKDPRSEFMRILFVGGGFLVMVDRLGEDEDEGNENERSADGVHGPDWGCQP